MDAACCIPVFVLAAAALMCLILQCGLEETASYALVQSARCSARAGALAGQDDEHGVALRTAFMAAWEGTLFSEWGAAQPEASVRRLTAGGEAAIAGGSIRVDHLVRVRVSVKNALLPKPGLSGDPESCKSVTFRPFLGESVQTDAYDRTHVYVFPKRGERYHIRSCSILQNGQVQVVLNGRIRRTCSACSLCNPDQLPDGAPVCLFSALSRVYHRQSCASVTKNFVCIPRSDAIAAGYAPCQLCGGGCP